MFVIHDLELRHRALDLVAVGVNDGAVSRRLGVARTTVRHWRWAKERNAPPRALCWRCWQPTRKIEPKIVADGEALLRRAFPECRVGRVIADGGSTVVLWVYHRHLSCLFPQHGPGKKHERAIELAPWQDDLVGPAPWAFVRGCIRSDGCSFVNRTGRYPRLACTAASTPIVCGSAAERMSPS